MRETVSDLSNTIPKGWKVVPLRWYMSCKSGESLDTSLIEKVVQEPTHSIPVIGGNGTMGYSTFSNTNSETISIGRVGALCGNVHYIDYECWITDNSLFVNRYRKEEIDLKFFSYVLEQLNLNQFSTSTAQPLITGETIKRRKIALPPLSEQKKIVSYIRWKVAEIDELIMNKEKLIQLLKEKRQSMITEAVTKGLNPNMKMKDSGVEWIGEIPESWSIKKIKYKFDIRKIIQPTEAPTVLSLTQKGLKVKDLNDFSGQHAESYDKYQRVEINDYVMNGMDLLTGYVDCAKFEGVTSPDYRVFRLRYPEECHDYYLRYFQMCYFAKIFYGHGQGVSHLGRWRLQTDVFKGFPIPEPPNDEQFAISKYLAEKEIEINEAIEMIKVQIQNLKDYRQSLIYEAVTGKSDVRNFEVES